MRIERRLVETQKKVMKKQMNDHEDSQIQYERGSSSKKENENLQ